MVGRYGWCFGETGDREGGCDAAIDLLFCNEILVVHILFS